MIIGQNTQEIALNNNLTITNETRSSYIECINTSSIHGYNTRFQTKLQAFANIYIPDVSSLNGQMDLIDDIIDLLNQMKKQLPGINYHINNGNLHRDISIQHTNNSFILRGKNIDLYSLLSTRIGIDTLMAIWNDNYQYDDSQYLTNEEYYNIFKPYKYTSQQCSSCTICLGEFIENDSVVKTKCNHTFHNKCLHRWLTKECFQPDCPLCRCNLDT